MGLDSGNSSSSQASSQTTQSTAGSQSGATTGGTSPVNTGNGTQLLVSGNYDASPTVVTAALNTIQQVVSQALADAASGTQAVADANQSNNAAQSDLLQQVLGSAQATAANTASGGQTNTNSTLTNILLGVGAIIAAILIFRKN